MTTSGYFDNLKNESSETIISFLYGILKAFSFINTKTDSIFNFSLLGYHRSTDNNLQDALKVIYDTEYDLKLSKIDDLMVKEILIKWLFNFVPSMNKYGRHAYLLDKHNDFSNSCSIDRNLFVEEFVYYLTQSINQLNIYRIDNLITKLRLGTDSDILCFETQEKVFLLSCSWDD